MGKVKALKLSVSFTPEELQEYANDLNEAGCNVTVNGVRERIEDEFLAIFDDLHDYLVGSFEAIPEEDD